MTRSKKKGDAARFSFSIALRASLVFIVLCGMVYPLVTTGAAQLLMPDQANGSLLKDGSGKVVGSELIGQNFKDPKFFQGRVSSIDNNGAGSGSNNYAPSNPDLIERTKTSIEAWKQNNPDVPVSEVPIDLVTNSGSGLDPHISPKSAEVQIPRISKLTGISENDLQKLVDEHVEGRDLGVFGEPRVNVLKLNLALSELLK
ncbi:potassium-transporting ATPase subunit KdpC [Paenibacillus sp. DMB20]|uniref:potassium-transporting ATPase subunit KdpC n=1 Tax=Paenibacillus sp. DMB20 TaxID=1642570 RepID=UPI0006280469|nr:potassium-transporting ATPase subunit KdpC [Paenibacillus sp. DMB20]KKO53939.1 potassium-transporting ATPase subunit C [Paenibacillus sp. DMB20]